MPALPCFGELVSSGSYSLVTGAHSVEVVSMCHCLKWHMLRWLHAMHAELVSNTILVGGGEAGKVVNMQYQNKVS